MRLKILLALIATTSVAANAAPVRYWAEVKRTQKFPPADAYAESVQAAQYLLRARGTDIVADGVFGRQTEAALKDFQRKHGVVASGALNGATWEVLVISLKPGARGDAVRAMQVLLNGFAAPEVKVDGIYGATTKAALLTFQKQMEIRVDGIVGKKTWSMLSPGQLEGC